MSTQKLLEVRAAAKKRKPVFSRKDNNKKSRIENDVWRKARGCDNKQRLRRKGHKKTPSQGYRSPVLVRGLDASGLMPVLVTNIGQLADIQKNEGIIVASNLGDRKRQLIITEAQKKNFKILNLDAAKASEQITARLKERQNERKKQLEESKQKEEKAKKDKAPKTEKKETTEEKSVEEKQQEEKEEKDKVLTSKN